MIVFDASTLILVAKAELLDRFFDAIALTVAISPEVYRECCGSKKSFDSLAIQMALDASKMKVLPIKNRKLVVKLQDDFSLGRGEAEAIVLALTEKARLVAIDDKNGINACKLLNVEFTTAIGILIRCRENGLLESADALSKLSILATYGRYKNSIIEEARLRLEAQR